MLKGYPEESRNATTDTGCCANFARKLSEKVSGGGSSVLYRA
jgi:hypothetical protein